MLNLEALDAEVSRLVDEATPELLPMLLQIFLRDDRPGLLTCERHTQHLFPYVRAQINLTRAKRNYYRDDWTPPCTHRSVEHSSDPEKAYDHAHRVRDEIRAKYRATPCTCWVPHR